MLAQLSRGKGFEKLVDGDHQWTGISTSKTGTTKMVDGVEHFVVNLEISAYSHPFYTGQQKFVDTAGRVDKFQQRAAKTAAAKEAFDATKKKKK